MGLSLTPGTGLFHDFIHELGQVRDLAGGKGPHIVRQAHFNTDHIQFGDKSVQLRCFIAGIMIRLKYVIK